MRRPGYQQSTLPDLTLTLVSGGGTCINVKRQVTPSLDPIRFWLLRWSLVCFQGCTNVCRSVTLLSLPTGAKSAIQADAVASLVHLLKGGRPEAQLSAANSLRLLAQHLRTATGSNLLLMSGA